MICKLSKGHLADLVWIIDPAEENGSGRPKAKSQKDCIIIIISSNRAILLEPDIASLIDYC